MAEQPVKWELNIHNLVTFIILFITMMLGAIIAGIIPYDPVGILVSLGFLGFLILVGFWIEWAGLGKYFGGGRG